MKKKSWKYVWHWRCTWDNGRGNYDPDCEGCGAHDRSGFDTKDKALTAASRHGLRANHGWQHLWRERKFSGIVFKNCQDDS